MSADMFFLYFCEYRGSSSASRISIELKSAEPTPTMMIDIGRVDPSTIASIAACISDMMPSVMINRMLYFWLICVQFMSRVISLIRLRIGAKFVGP